MQTVICTGIAGTERRQCLEDLKTCAVEYGAKVEVIDMWQVMQETSMQSRGQELDEATFLNMGRQERLAVIGRAFGESGSRLQQMRSKNNRVKNSYVVIAARAICYWASSYIEAVPAELVKQLEPDVLFTIIGNVRDIKANLDADLHDRFSGITLLDILHWRYHEIEETSKWAEAMRIRHYVVARTESKDTLPKLVFRPSTKKIYTSYPMSHVSQTEMEAAKKLIADLRAMDYIVFDPGSIDDSQFLGKLAEERTRGEGLAANYSDADLRNLSEDVGDHTVKLDYGLIDQSDAVLVRYPSVGYVRYMREANQAVPAMYVPLSAGVICEMVRGHQTAKRVYSLWLPRNIEPSPFFRFHSFKLFTRKRELLSYLRHRYPAR